jgi:hypothetical protein
LVASSRESEGWIRREALIPPARRPPPVGYRVSLSCVARYNRLT